MKRLSSLLFIVTFLAGCQPKPALHPGSISSLDSYAYDILLIEQDTLNNAKAEFAAGKLPAAAKDPLNAAITQYNLTEAAWRSYHSGGAGETVLQKAVAALVAAMGDLERAINPNYKVNPITMWEHDWRLA